MRRWSWLKTASLWIVVAWQSAQADGTVRSEFIFQMNNSVFGAEKFNFSKQLIGTQKLTLPDTVVQDELPVHVKGISGEVTYDLAAGSQTIFLGAEIAFLSKSLFGKITINEISVNGYVDRWVDGRQIRVLVAGSCGGIQLQLAPGKAKIFGSVATGVDRDGLPSITLPYLDTQWSADAWSIGDFSCTTGDGFKDRVLKGLKNYLSNANGLNGSVKTALATRLADYEQTVRAEFKTAINVPLNMQGVRATLYPLRIANVKDDGFQVMGQMDVVFTSQGDAGLRTVSAAGAPRQVNGFSILFPETLVEALNDVAFRTGSYIYRKRGQEIPAFKDLMASSSSQYFVWTELQQYPADADFIFDFWTSEKPALGDFQQARSGVLNAQFAGSIYVLAWAPIANTWRKMVRFASPLSAGCTISFLKTATGSDLHLLMKSTHMDLSATWDSEYQPYSDYINVSTLQEKIIASFETDGLRLPFQKLNLMNWLGLTASGLTKRGPWLSIELQ